MRPLLIISGVPIDDLVLDDAINRIDEFVLNGRETGRSHQIATVNAEFVVKAHSDPELRRILQEADMAIVDGMPLVWGARLLGVPLSGRVTCVDLVPALAERAAQKGYAVKIHAASPETATRAAHGLQSRYPGLRVAGVTSPFAKSLFEMDQDLLQSISASHPDILLVAFGNSQQEKWINMSAPYLNIPVIIGIGSALDQIVGSMGEAPQWAKRVGLARLHQWMQEPRRLWKRYVVDTYHFCMFFARQWWALHHIPDRSILLPWTDVILIDRVAILRINGRLDRNNIAEFTRRAQEALSKTPRIVVNLAKAEYMDSSAIGTLVSLTKQARDCGGDFVLAGAQPQILKILSLLKLDRFFVMHPNIEGAKSSFQKGPKPSQSDANQKAMWTVVQAPRRLDDLTSPDITRQCIGRLSTNPRLVLDLSNTNFLSSAGLAAMLQVSREAASKGGELRVAGCAGDVLRTIQLARLDKSLTLYNTVRQAAV